MVETNATSDTERQRSNTHHRSAAHSGDVRVDASHDRSEFLTLSQASRFVPGKTSPNALWRWCRRGVLARTGQRVHLQHVRLGGKLLTTRRWLDEFGERLADADKAYFDLATPEPAAAPPAQTRWSAPTPAKRRRARSDADLADHHARIAAELDAEGL